MLNRLPELRKAARLPNQETPLPTDTVEDRLAHAIASDERSVKAICADLRVRVAELRRLGTDVKKAILPGRIQELQQQQEARDLACQQLVHQSRELLQNLEGNAQQREDIEQCGTGVFLQEVRAAAVSHWREQVKAAVLEFFEARGKLKDEVQALQCRRLRLAYPEADEEALEMALASPELAAQAIVKRADLGDHVSLRVILSSLDNTDDRRIEEAAKNLKLIFLQFAELVDAQGETLNEIEANIDTTIEHVGKAREKLEEARILQTKNWRQAVKFKFCCCCSFCILCIVFSFWLVPYGNRVLRIFGINAKLPDWHLPTPDLRRFRHLDFSFSDKVLGSQAPDREPGSATGDASAQDQQNSSLMNSSTKVAYRAFGPRPRPSFMAKRSGAFLWPGASKEPEERWGPEQRPRRLNTGAAAARLVRLMPGQGPAAARH